MGGNQGNIWSQDRKGLSQWGIICRVAELEVVSKKEQNKNVETTKPNP